MRTIVSQRALILLACTSLLVLLLPTLASATENSGTEPAMSASGMAPASSPAETPEGVQPPAPPQRSLFPPELAERVSRLASDVESAVKAIERVKDRESGLAEQRAELERIQSEAPAVIASLRPLLDAVTAQLQKLGPAPAPDAPPEAPALASERARLSALEAEISGAMKTAELALVRSRQLISYVQELRQAIFQRNLMQRWGSPLDVAIWQKIYDELPRAARQVAYLARDWWRLASRDLFSLALVGFFAAGAYVLARLFLRRGQHSVNSSAGGILGHFPRAGNALWAALSRAVPPLAAAASLYGGLYSFDLLTLTVGEFARAALATFAIYVGLTSIGAVVLASRPPELPLLDIADASAPKLLRLLQVFAALLAIDWLFREVIRMLFLPIEIGVIEASLTSLAFAGLLIAFVRVPLATRSSALLEPPSRAYPHWLKLPIMGLALTIIGTTLAGYVALGRFISTQVMVMGGTAVVLFLAHTAIHRLSGVLFEGDQRVGRILETRLGLDHERTSYLTRSLVMFIELVVLLAAIPVILLTWGYAREDIVDWLRLVVSGFEIGQYRIAPVRVLLALLLFVGLLFITRLGQRWLKNSVLGPARVDNAIAHSILMGVGYSGVALSILIALSYAGFDFTQLAIVAGALSLGIGFGLQAIFNNFVSGIILLIERPIKVGDWIVVNGQEGFVRRINVRATEIETFDRASLIIPNSELITGTVLNWTHTNAVGRLVIPVRVAYSADPERVIAILSRIAEQSPSLLKLPAPAVVFEDFAESAQIFSLRAFVPDVSRRLAVSTELRLAIAKAFKEEGIEIPFPQHDLHLRDLDGLKQAFARALEARRRENEVEAGTA